MWGGEGRRNQQEAIEVECLKEVPVERELRGEGNGCSRMKRRREGWREDWRREGSRKGFEVKSFNPLTSGGES